MIVCFPIGQFLTLAGSSDRDSLYFVWYPVAQALKSGAMELHILESLPALRLHDRHHLLCPIFSRGHG